MSSQKSTNYVNYVIGTISKNKGFAAKMKRADNENTEYQSWEILSRWINLDYEKDRKAYGLIGASLSRSNCRVDGSLGLGRALYMVHKDNGGTSDLLKSPATARLRRLLSCHDSLELITILRPVLRLLESKDISVSYALLLDNILWFNHDNSRERIRSHWAQDFFGSKEVE